MQSSILPLLPILLATLAATGCLVGAFWNLRRRRLIEDLPTSKTQGVFIGLTELKGIAESETPLTSYLTRTSCVQYVWKVEEQWARTVTETYRNAQGHTHTRTRQETGWTKVAGAEQTDPFYLKDDTGIIRIVPEGARIQGVAVLNETCTPLNPMYFEKGPPGAIANSTHRRRFHETVLPLHAMLYVMGQARERQDIVAAEIARDSSAPIFLISVKSEKQVSSSYAIWFWVWMSVGLLLALTGTTLSALFGAFNMALAWQLPVTAAAYGLILLLGWVWTVYNSLIRLRQRVEQAWSAVDIQLKRRNDLIPNLAGIVEGYRSHEKETLQLVAELRSQLAATPPGVAGPDFKGFASKVLAVRERYPELMASEQFLALQKSLSETEQRIALSRDYFNQIAAFHNIRLEIIPDRFVARLARLKVRPLMTASEFERADIVVKLA